MLTQTATYALRALIHLAHQPDDDFHQTRDVAGRVHVPSNYLGKILQKLARARIVDSQKGLHGGFRIARLPEQVRLYDVLNALESLPVQESSGKSEEQVELANLNQRFASLDRVYTQFLMDTTLADVMEPDRQLDERREVEAKAPVAVAPRRASGQDLVVASLQI